LLWTISLRHNNSTLGQADGAVSLTAMDSPRFDATVYTRRLAAAAAATADAGLAGLVITPGYDLRYLIGSRAQTFERLTALVLPASGDPTVVVPRLELASLKGSAVAELDLAVRDWVDGDDPYQLVCAAGRCARRAAGLGDRRVAGAADDQGCQRD
jgi:Xaa-Pro aminopeptidase